MRRLCVVLVALAACGDNAHVTGSPDAAGSADAAGPPDAAGSPDADPNMPQTLAETGLCVDAACTTISPDVHVFTPRYALWADGAGKDRWIYLPPGAQIDTSDMDWWQFPQGTKLWKEFDVGNVRVETRMLSKIGPNPSDWYMQAYAWNQAEDQAVATPDGAFNVLGTTHDIPSHTQCRRCHENTPGRVLGFSAILLDHDHTLPGLTLDDLVQQGLLTAPPTAVSPGVYFPIPGDQVAQDALGYLSSNCGGCHNPTSPVMNQVPVDWRLRVALLGSVNVTPAYTSAVGVTPSQPIGGATAILQPMDPAHSAAYLRLTSTSPAEMMPPIGHETVDTDGAAALAAWINELQ